MKTKVHPVELEALKFARNSFDYLFITTSFGAKKENLKKVFLESFTLGKLKACERLLTLIENNHLWVREHVLNEVFAYLSEINSLGEVFKKYNRSNKKIIEKLCFRYLEGQKEGSTQFAENVLKNTTDIRDKNDSLAEAHIMIMNENNLFVEKFNKGEKIGLEFFTDKYLKNPELLSRTS